MAVEFESAGERVQVGQVFGVGLVDPAGEALIVAGSGGQQGDEVADETGQHTAPARPASSRTTPLTCAVSRVVRR